MVTCPTRSGGSPEQEAAMLSADVWSAISALALAVMVGVAVFY
jgi:hypothetical protein